MGLAKLKSGCLIGSSFLPINIEASVLSGLPHFIIIGLPDKQIEEAKERIRSSIRLAKYKMPSGRVIINLSPGHIQKNGTWYDLGIAIAILEASGQIINRLSDMYFFGELTLSGRVISGGRSLPVPCLHLNEKGKSIVPNDMPKITVDSDNHILVDTLQLAIDYVEGKVELTTQKPIFQKKDREEVFLPEKEEYLIDQVKGQENAKRAIQIAIAGGHNVVLSGPPGCGKTTLAMSSVELLPKLSLSDAVRLDRVYSQVNLVWQSKYPPIRSPHHSISPSSFMGGGKSVLPGEIALANGGVLFMDEYPLFNKKIREALKVIVESKKYICRQKGVDYAFNTDFILIIAKNTCPCGPVNSICKCKNAELVAYSNSLDGPMQDRIDLYCEMKPVSPIQAVCQSGRKMVQEISTARRVQKMRYGRDLSFSLNGNVNYTTFLKKVDIEKDALDCLEEYSAKSAISLRSTHKVLRVARTVADLEEEKKIKIQHIREALIYRKRDALI